MMATKGDDDIKPVLHQTAKSGGELNAWFILKDITGEQDGPAPEKKQSKFSHFMTKVKDSVPNATYGSGGDLLVVPISMMESEYENYFAVDDITGQLLPNVSAPAGGRRQWLQDKLDQQKPKARKVREVSGMAMRAGGVVPGGPAGIGPMGMGA